MSFLKAVMVSFNPAALGIVCDWNLQYTLGVQKYRTYSMHAKSLSLLLSLLQHYYVHINFHATVQYSTNMPVQHLNTYNT